MLFMLIATVFSHNWIHSPSRVSKGSTILPAPPKAGPRRPQYQVGAGQEFGVEWATGHPSSWYYFVVLKASDEDKLILHTEEMLAQYVYEAPSEAYIYSDDRFQRMHVSCTHLYPDNPGGSRDCDQDTWNDGVGYEREISPDEDIYFDREAAWGPFSTQDVHFKYSDDQRKNDARVAYYNPQFPWIEAVHKFHISIKQPREWDVARFSLPARQGSGEYIIHMLWRGYRDVIDIDVLPVFANDIYGSESSAADSVWTKTEHCFYPNFSENKNSDCLYFQADEDNNIAACKEYCESRVNNKCEAMNVVPFINPEPVIAAGRPATPLLPDNNKCAPKNAPDWADEKTMVCYTFRENEPTYDGFNIETEDIWIIRDNDPADPIFYSTCYRRTSKRVFQGNADCPLCEKKVPSSLKWQINDQCLSCEDAIATLDENTVKFWETTKMCEKCF